MVDTLGKTVLRKVTDLVDARPDVDWATLGKAIHRGPSWISEFQHGKRTTNDLRLVVKIARFFSVPVGYLLNESDDRDPLTVMLLGAWSKVADQKPKEAVLALIVTLGPPAPEEHS